MPNTWTTYYVSGTASNTSTWSPPPPPTNHDRNVRWWNWRINQPGLDEDHWTAPIKPERHCKCSVCTDLRAQFKTAEAKLAAEAEAKRQGFAAKVAERGRGWGVEIECMIPEDLGDYYTNYAKLKRELKKAGVDHEEWTLHDDGSIDARDEYARLELSSPILYGEEGIKTMRAMMAALRKLGARVNRSCGLHIHLGAEDWSPEQRTNIAAAFVRYEPFFDQLVPPSRRANENQYCQSNRSAAHGRGLKAKIKALRKTAKTVKALEDKFDDGDDKYLKLNVSALDARGTFEFRQHSGTLNGDKAEHWVRLLLAFTKTFADQSFAISESESSAAFAAFLDKLKLRKRTVQFLKARRRQLAARDSEDE